jgi:hypothetical protein
MARFWPIPMHDNVNLDGRVTYVPHFVAYAHKCIPWPAVKVLDLHDLKGRSWPDSSNVPGNPTPGEA